MTRSVFFDKVVAGAGFCWAVGGVGCGSAVEPDGPVANAEPVAEVAENIVFGGHDYLFYVTPQTRATAKAACESMGYHLLTTNDLNEQAYMHAQEVSHGGGQWWIGYSDELSEGFWRWDDGTPNGFVNWAVGEPNNQALSFFFGLRLTENCAVDNFKPTGEWGDVFCTNLAKFVCERGAVPTGNYAAFNYSAADTNSALQNSFGWAVNLAASQSLTLGTCGLNGAAVVGDSYLRLFNPSGAEVGSNDDSCGGVGSNFSYLAPVSGTYTVRAGCYSSSACSGTVALATCLSGAACRLSSH